MCFKDHRHIIRSISNRQSYVDLLLLGKLDDVGLLLRGDSAAYDRVGFHAKQKELLADDVVRECIDKSLSVNDDGHFDIIRELLLAETFQLRDEVVFARAAQNYLLHSRLN